MASIATKLRAVLTLMCIDLPSRDEPSETEDKHVRVRKRIKTKSANTLGHARNTLMGLPTELRLTIYQFALQDVVDSTVSQASWKPRAISYHSESYLGGLALPLINRTLRKESLDAYGPLVKKHRNNLWQHYIGLQEEAIRLPVLERLRDLNEEFDAYYRWRAVERLQRVVDCLYVDECFVCGYCGELHAGTRRLEWRARA
jgi:hypothetical protein